VRNMIFSITLVTLLSGVQLAAMQAPNVTDLCGQVCELVKKNDINALKTFFYNYFSETAISEGSGVDLRRVLNPAKGYTPLYFAVKNDNFEMVKILVENGADISWKLQSGRYTRSLVHVAKSYEVIEYLCIYLDKPLSIDAGIPGATALDEAIQNNNQNKIAILVKCYELLLILKRICPNQIAAKFANMRFVDICQLSEQLKQCVINRVLGESK